MTHVPANRERAEIVAGTGEDPVERIFAAWLRSKKPDTIRAYTSDLAHLSTFLGVPTSGGVLRHLAALGPVDGRVALMDWIGSSYESGSQHATVRRRAAAVNQFLKLMHESGAIPFLLRVQTPPDEGASVVETKTPYVKMRGVWKKILKNIENAAETGDPQGIRDEALLLIMHDSALRRSEALSIDIAHVNLDDGTVTIAAKGRRRRVPVPISHRAKDAIARWIIVRGDAPGALFTPISRSGLPMIRRLTPEGVRLILLRISSGVGLVLRPHDLRRLAITRALELTDGDIPAAQRLGRHKDPGTTMVYDLRRRSVSRDMVDLIAKEEE